MGAGARERRRQSMADVTFRLDRTDVIALEHWCSSGFANTDLDFAAQEARHSPTDRDRPAREHLHRLDNSSCGGTGLRSHAGEGCHRGLRLGRNESHARVESPQLCPGDFLDGRIDRCDPEDQRLKTQNRKTRRPPAVKRMTMLMAMSMRS